MYTFDLPSILLHNSPFTAALQHPCLYPIPRGAWDPSSCQAVVQHKDQTSSSKDSLNGIFGSKQASLVSFVMMTWSTHALILKSFHNSECFWVMYVLHDQPVDGFFVLAIDSCRLNELGLDALNGIRLVVGVEMNSKCVNHCVSCSVIQIEVRN